jgi:hydroxymethylglutaryl-CoA lyase
MTTNPCEQLYVHEVCTRDGFQMESTFIPTAQKVALINALSRSGLHSIEVTSFTSPKAIPALADAAAVMQAIERVPGVVYAALVPNLRGAQRALEVGVDELNLVMSASETHSRANLRMSTQDSLAEFEAIVRHVQGQATVNVSISTAFGCPFEGEIDDKRIHQLISQVVELGVRHMTLCDTTGMAHPAQVERVFQQAVGLWPSVRWTAHFHNTRAMGLPNVLAALTAGVRHFDASLGGLGGCPYAPGATGNVCTEDMVHMLHAMGWHTGVDLGRLMTAALTLPSVVGHEVPGQVMKAGALPMTLNAAK